ncbi:MAG: prolipoprotein diacylglyceryl transferase [Eubacteriales bacterium]|nr:prolipoprotein diacylglyceryl transferase [Eubacteriales bacterium]
MSESTIMFPNLGIVLPHVGKSVSVLGFEIAFYGMVIALGMLCGISLLTKVAERTGQDKEMYFDLSLITIVCAILGARLYYVIFSWDSYKNNLIEIFNFRGGGLAIYGGVLAGILTVWIFSVKKKKSFGQLADTICTGLVVGQIIGRWGNFFNREAFGGYTDGFFAMALPQAAVRADEITAEMSAKAYMAEGTKFIQVHPTFLYESLWNICVLILLLVLTRKKRFHGEVFLAYLAGYGLGRFWIEGLRTDQLLLPGIGLPVSQVLSGMLFVISIIILFMGLKKCKKDKNQI